MGAKSSVLGAVEEDMGDGLWNPAVGAVGVDRSRLSDFSEPSKDSASPRSAEEEPSSSNPLEVGVG